MLTPHRGILFVAVGVPNVEGSPPTVVAGFVELLLGDCVGALTRAAPFQYSPSLVVGELTLTTEPGKHGLLLVAKGRRRRVGSRDGTTAKPRWPTGVRGVTRVREPRRPAFPWWWRRGGSLLCPVRLPNHLAACGRASKDRAHQPSSVLRAPRPEALSGAPIAPGRDVSDRAA